MADDDLRIDTEPESNEESGDSSKLPIVLGLVGVAAILLAGLSLYLGTNTTRAVEQLDRKMQGLEARADPTAALSSEIEQLRAQLEELQESIERVGGATTRIRGDTQRSLESLAREIQSNRGNISRHAELLNEFNQVIANLQQPATTRQTSPEATAPRNETTDQERPEDGYHVIVAGDTFGSLARRYGVTVDQIQQANPDLDPRRLRIGERVRIP